jgi:hypothetical protein
MFTLSYEIKAKIANMTGKLSLGRIARNLSDLLLRNIIGS